MSFEVVNIVAQKTTIPTVDVTLLSTKQDFLQIQEPDKQIQSEEIYIQPKLFVGAVDDPLEDEADAMADKVMRMPEQSFIQHKCTHCEEKRAQRKPLTFFIQKKQAGNYNIATDSISNQIQSTKGSGNAMSESTKSFMESRFGADFSNVNIHTGNYATQLSKNLNAQAFTVGNDIYFNEGKYQPESAQGKDLLAHELTHVLQQKSDPYSGNSIKRQVAPSDSFLFNDPKDQNPVSAPNATGLSVSQLSKKVYVEQVLTQVGNLYIRFSYPQVNFQGTSPSSNIATAKKAITNALKDVVTELTSTYTGTGSLQKNQDRARLSEIISVFGQSNPLNIFIDTNSVFSAMRGSSIAALTGAVYIDMNDVGNPKKLRAAILIPDTFIFGGIGPGGTSIPAASADETKATLLHEGVHSVLIQKAVDAETIWKTKIQQKLTFNKTPKDVAEKFSELVRDYLISQEEIFAYNEEAIIYPLLPSNVSLYNSFIKLAETFFSKKNINTGNIKEPITVGQKVNKRKVNWEISYKLPTGAVNLTSTDISTIDFIISNGYPLK